MLKKNFVHLTKMAKSRSGAWQTGQTTKSEKRKRDEKKGGKKHDGTRQGKQKRLMRESPGGHDTIAVILHSYLVRVSQKMK